MDLTLARARAWNAEARPQTHSLDGEGEEENHLDEMPT